MIEHGRLSYRIIGCAIAVHRAMGPGLVESVYEECLDREMRLSGLIAVRQPRVSVKYEGTILNQKFRPDFIVGDKIVVELKSVDKIVPVHVAQVLTYMKLANLPLGLIINFNTVHVTKGIRRLIMTDPAAPGNPLDPTVL